MSYNYPLEILTFTNDKNKLPKYVDLAIEDIRSKGFCILPITPDHRKEEEIKIIHAGFTWLKHYTMPKLLWYAKTNKDIKGFFIAEGDLCLNYDYDFKRFIEEKHTKPVWLGYKKKMNHYIVGNFLLYFPRDSLEELNRHFVNQKRNCYSDRFFKKLVDIGFLDIVNETRATEIEHYSNVIKGIREEPRAHIVFS